MTARKFNEPVVVSRSIIDLEGRGDADDPKNRGLGSKRIGEAFESASQAGVAECNKCAWRRLGLCCWVDAGLH